MMLTACLFVLFSWVLAVCCSQRERGRQKETKGNRTQSKCRGGFHAARIEVVPASTDGEDPESSSECDWWNARLCFSWFCGLSASFLPSHPDGSFCLCPPRRAGGGRAQCKNTFAWWNDRERNDGRRQRGRGLDTHKRRMATHKRKHISRKARANLVCVSAIRNLQMMMATQLVWNLLCLFPHHDKWLWEREKKDAEDSKIRPLLH